MARTSRCGFRNHARVFAAARSAAKLELCREFGADVMMNWQGRGFANTVLDETNGRGVDGIFGNVGESVMEQSMKCIAYNGRHLMMGFASDKSVVKQQFIVPRSVSAGNFKLCGVMLAYASEASAPVMKRGMGWSFAPDQLGERIMREIDDLVLRKRIKPVIGRIAEFEQLPAAIETLANRETVGRTIVRLW